MFLGHFAVGFAAKRAAPRHSLALLFVAAQFADLLWPVLVAAGIESVRIAPGTTAFTPLDFVSYPWSHSLAALVLWAVLLAAIVRARSRTARGALVVAALVLSHWVLDVITHRPDVPLYPGGPRLGLGLWNSVAGTILVELLLFAVGVWLYARATRPRDRVGQWSFSLFVVLLLVLYAANLAGAPPSVAAIWTAGLVGGVLLAAWSWWFDRHRAVLAG
jgi:membrane-bound metal-dependent hydrolase YbcI (DUF457 family)